MDAGFLIGAGGWVAAGILWYLYSKLNQKFGRQKGVIDGLKKELERTQDRIDDLMRNSNDKLPVVDEAGRIRDS